MGLDAAGFEPIAHAEIEPNARAVLRRQWPTVPLHGDVAQIDGTQFRGVTLISGGSPCQDLSVAGRRAGLDGARSGLFHEQVRIWKESEAPYLIWENVLGALSSNNGHDFAAVLSAFVGADVAVPQDGWRKSGVAAGSTGVAAWRVLDLQHFGPPQRRRRVFVVAARAGGVDPAEVLALSEGVCGHPSPRQQAREIAASSVRGGVEGVVEPVFPTLTMGAHTAGPGGNGQDALQIQQTLSAVGVGLPRRITPLECERLMSWPDHWTRYGAHEDGTPFLLSDAARYRLCGNGVGSVCVAWFAARLARMVEAASCPP